MISDVPEGPGDRRAHRPRTAAALVAALAAALLATALAGCGGGGGDGSTAGGTGASVSTTPAPQTQTTASTRTTTTGGSNGGQAGRGDGSNGGQAGQSLTPPQLVEAVLTSSDPSVACSTEYVTAHYLGAAYGGRQGCVQGQSPKSAATSVQIKDLQAADSTATPPTAKATVVADGGLYDGEKLTVSLVKEDGAWKVDGLNSNARVGP